jgi:predicted DNA-binding transcriptional regulator AlpA
VCQTWRISVKTFDTPARKLRVMEAATFLSVSKSWLDKKRITGDGPVYIKAGRRVVYDLCDLEIWVASRKRRHTSEVIRILKIT